VTYIPHTPAERQAMLGTLGVWSLDELFAHVPAEVKAPPLKLPRGLSEMELCAELARYAARNRSAQELTCFLGAGAYDHFIPAAVDQLILRGELFTAYTPYQPEISQGILQLIYEYQTMLASLCGCDVANASLYDGATAMVEACQMAVRHTGRKIVVLDAAIHPHYCHTVCSMLRPQGVEVRIVAPQASEFRSNFAGLAAAAGPEVAVVAVGYPNFGGAIDDLRPLAEAAHAAGALFVAVSDPFAFGVLEPAGKLGADIVCGEAQSLGVPLQFGGPYLGYLACRKELVRRMPGRLVGQTVDLKGRRAFTLTLQAREQHIRREKATSNICTNTALCALMAHFYMSCVGPAGLKRAGELCISNAALFRAKLRGCTGVKSVPEYPVFNEFVIETVKPAAEVLDALLKAGILGGLNLGNLDPARASQILVAVTEKRTAEEMDAYVRCVAAC
jgi:glycine dehydrogenase subunit 1